MGFLHRSDSKNKLQKFFARIRVLATPTEALATSKALAKLPNINGL